jgi:membrane protein
MPVVSSHASVPASTGGTRRLARVLTRALLRFWRQNMLHHAAALTYQSVLAVFQVILLAVALLGLLGTSQTLDDLARFLVDRGADARLVDGLVAAGRHAIEARGTSALALVVAIAVAVVVASSAFVAATVALNVVVEARDDRSALRRRAEATGAAVVMILLWVGAVIAIFLGGDLAERAFDVIGLGGTAAALWSVVRFPIAALLAMTTFAWLYYAAPTVPDPRWRWISLGAVVAVVVWLAASVGLFVFAGNVGAYNATYGAFATAILLIVWLWLTNVALLIGAEINAAGRYEEGAPEPLSRSGDSPETAHHEAAKRTLPREESVS